MDKTLAQQALEFTGEIHMQMKGSAAAYHNYLQGGKTYMHAHILRQYNARLRDMLLQKGYLLSEALQEDALALVDHYDVWMQKWDELERKLSPALSDEFVFPNEVTFPKTAAANLEKEFQRLIANFKF